MVRHCRSCLLLFCVTAMFALETVAADIVVSDTVNPDTATSDSVASDILTPAPAGAGTAKDTQAIPVETKSVSELAFFPEYRAPANVDVLNQSHISAEISAVVREIPVRVGDVVKQGAALALLDCRDYRLVVAREQALARSVAARLAFAEYQLQRVRTLTTQKAVAEELLRQRETDLAVLQAEQASQQVAIKQAERNVSNCTLYSPFDAIVLERMGQVGELAAPGVPLLRIMDAENREVVAKLQHHQIDSVQMAKDISLVVRGKRYPLTLRSVTANIDTRERTREVRLLFNAEKALPGTSGELLWKTSEPHLPAEYVVQRNGMLGVFVVENNSAKFHTIEQATEGRPVAIDLSNGINSKTLVITRGRYRLQPGDAVSFN